MSNIVIVNYTIKYLIGSGGMADVYNDENNIIKGNITYHDM
jgi:hypothetical protein